MPRASETFGGDLTLDRVIVTGNAAFWDSPSQCAAE